MNKKLAIKLDKAVDAFNEQAEPYEAGFHIFFKGIDLLYETTICYSEGKLDDKTLGIQTKEARDLIHQGAVIILKHDPGASDKLKRLLSRFQAFSDEVWIKSKL